MEANPMAVPTPGTSDRRRTAFMSVSVAFVAFLYLFSPFSSLFLGWFVDFDDAISHRVHEITFGMLLAMVLVGVIVQLRSPQRHIAGIQQAVAVVVILTAVVTVSTGWERAMLLYVVPVVAIAALHPSRREVLRPRIRPAAGLLFLMVMLTFPALVAFADEFSKAANEVREHQAHWGGMAAFGLSILATGYLAALRVRGWPVAAWTTGTAMLVYGIASLRFRFDASARPYLGGILVLVWGVVWLVTAERARRDAAREHVASPSQPGADSSGAVLLRRARRGRLLGGVALGVARYLGVRVLFVRLLAALSSIVLVGPFVYGVAWLRIPMEAPDEIVAVPAGVVPTALATRRSRVALMAPVLVLAVLLGVCSQGAFESFAPPVPHTITAATPQSCIECHGSGDEHAPVIDPLTHNFYSDFADRRSFVPFCGECHDLPAISATLEAAEHQPAGSGGSAPPDGFSANHPDMYVLGENDMARLLSFGASQGTQP